MQKDYHHTTTYVIARLAGFTHKEADIIAYAAQYVDDATNEGAIEFTNGALYHRTCSAHKMLDYRNFKKLANHRSWIPFHFLPGNGGLPAGQTPPGSFSEKLIARPNSYVAQDVLKSCIANKHKDYGLHRLGVTAHVYVDTWAHQGFAGISHLVNTATALDEENETSKKLNRKLKQFFGDLYDEYTGKILSNALPLGHGATLSYPDRPYLVWRYKNYKDEIIERNNPDDYVAASTHLYRFFKAWQVGGKVEDAPFMPEDELQHLRSLFLSIQDENENDRHQTWIDLIARGEFSFGPQEVSYVGKGHESWKHKAIGVTGDTDDPDDRYEFTNDFLTCNWKLFHDALLAHRFEVIHEILPRYHICIA